MSPSALVKLLVCSRGSALDFAISIGFCWSRAPNDRAGASWLICMGHGGMGCSHADSGAAGSLELSGFPVHHTYTHIYYAAPCWDLHPAALPHTPVVFVSQSRNCIRHARHSSSAHSGSVFCLASPWLRPCLPHCRPAIALLHSVCIFSAVASGAYPWTLVTFLQVRCGSASRVWRCGVCVFYRLAGRPEREECASANV